LLLALSLMWAVSSSSFIGMKKYIDVAAAVILSSNKVLAARRRPKKHLAGYWEFPGGKVEVGETPEVCLERELQEELGIRSRVVGFLGESLFDYETKAVRLLAYQVEHLEGEFQLIDHDDLRWLRVDELASVKWAPADIPLLEFCRVIMART